MNKELRDKIVKILMENITFGEKNKKVYVSKIAPKLEKLFESDWDKPEIKEPLDWLKRNEVLDEAIATFKEYRNEPMTGNVVILELKALKHGK